MQVLAAHDSALNPSIPDDAPSQNPTIRKRNSSTILDQADDNLRHDYGLPAGVDRVSTAVSRAELFRDPPWTPHHRWGSSGSRCVGFAGDEAFDEAEFESLDLFDVESGGGPG
jgi:hypothetical protein